LIGVVVVTHGKLAEGLLDAMRMIAGEREALSMVSLGETDDVDTLVDRVGDAAAAIDDGDGVLVFVDLFGASPFNASARLALQKREGVEVVTGVNLPMLLEVVMSREGMTLAEAADLACQVGAEGIRKLSDTLKPS
jgi:mannose PTS system EIIA component